MQLYERPMDFPGLQGTRYAVVGKNDRTYTLRKVDTSGELVGPDISVGVMIFREEYKPTQLTPAHPPPHPTSTNGSQDMNQPPRVLKLSTPLWVTGRDGTCKMTFSKVLDAVRGGMDPATVEITMDEVHSKRLEQKRLAVQRVNQLLGNMTPEQVEKVVEIIQGREDLMNMHEDYA